MQKVFLKVTRGDACILATGELHLHVAGNKIMAIPRLNIPRSRNLQFTSHGMYHRNRGSNSHLVSEDSYFLSS